MADEATKPYTLKQLAADFLNWPDLLAFLAENEVKADLEITADLRGFDKGQNFTFSFQPVPAFDPNENICMADLVVFLRQIAAAITELNDDIPPNADDEEKTKRADNRRAIEAAMGEINTGTIKITAGQTLSQVDRTAGQTLSQVDRTAVTKQVKAAIIQNVAQALYQVYLSLISEIPEKKEEPEEEEPEEGEEKRAKKEKKKEETEEGPPEVEKEAEVPVPPPPPPPAEEPSGLIDPRYFNPRYLTSAYADLVLESTLAYLGTNKEQLDPAVYAALRERSFEIINGLILGLSKEELMKLANLTDPDSLTLRYQLSRQGHELFLQIPGVIPLIRNAQVDPKKIRNETTLEEHLKSFAHGNADFFEGLAELPGFDSQSYTNSFISQATAIVGDAATARTIALRIEAAVLSGQSPRVLSSMLKGSNEEIRSKLQSLLGVELTDDQIRQLVPFLKDYWKIFRAGVMKIDGRAGIDHLQIDEDASPDEFAERVGKQTDAMMQAYGQINHNPAIYVQRCASSYSELQAAGDENSSAAIEGYWQKLTVQERTVFYLQTVAVQVDAETIHPDFSVYGEQTQTTLNNSGVGESPTALAALNQDASNFGQNANSCLNKAKSAIKSGADKAYGKLGETAIRVGANLVAAGAGEAYVKFKAIASRIPGLGRVIEKTEKVIGKIIAGAAAATTLIIIKTIAAATTLLGFLGGLALGTVGFITGGPAGATAGFIMGANKGADLQHKLLGKHATAKTRAVPTRTATTIKVGKVPGKASLTQATTPATTPWTPEMILKAPAVTKIATWKAFFSHVGVSAPLTTVGIMIGGTVFTMLAIQSAFLVDLPYTAPLTALTSEFKESQYLFVEKTVDLGLGCQDNRCENPNFPFEARYSIVIKPKENYKITITDIEDELRVHHNEEMYSGETPDIEDKIRSFDDFNNIEQSTVLEPGQELRLSYTEIFDEDYNHASVRNKFTIEFAYENADESGSDDAITGEVVCIGECPQGLGCWPTSGIVKQLPFGSFSHISDSGNGADAYDIAAPMGTPVFAPFAGELCSKPDDPNGYGMHLILKTNIDGKDRLFMFAHLSQKVETGCKQVMEGEIIGRVGSTGRSTGPHLHFEMGKGGSFYAHPGARSSDFPTKSDLAKLMPDGEFININEVVRSCFGEVN
ncbi:MAG: M23 family metallopeptidase [Candidatus Woesebacteria bacterium]|jgi:hypothetical protein